MGAGLLALGGLITTAMGVANADDEQLAGTYGDQLECLADGPHMQSTISNGSYTGWDCVQGGDGLWYLWLHK